MLIPGKRIETRFRRWSFTRRLNSETSWIVGLGQQSDVYQLCAEQPDLRGSNYFQPAGTTPSLLAFGAGSQHPHTYAPPPVLLSALHSRNYGLNFNSRREEYISCWFETTERVTGREDIRIEVGGFGVPALYLSDISKNTWLANCRLPPGLTKGWNKVRLRLPQSEFSNALNIAVDLIPKTGALVLVSVQDGIAWLAEEVRIHDGGFVTLWVKGLAQNCDRNNTHVLLDGQRLPVLYVGDLRVDGSQQVNAKVLDRIPRGKHRIMVRVGTTNSNEVCLDVR